MVAQYPFQRPKEPGLTRTVIRISIVFGCAIALFQGYPFIRSVWRSWIPGAAQESTLDTARQRLESGDAKGAAELLDAEIARATELDSDTLFALLRQRIDLARKEGDWSTAGEGLKRVLVEFPESEEYPSLAAEFGEALEKQGRIQEARAQYTELGSSAPQGMRAPALLGLGRLAEAEHEPVQARDLYRDAFNDAAADSGAWMQALEAMGRLNSELIFAQMETPESKYYTVEPGDTLTSIGIKLNTTQGLLMRANGISDPAKLHPGQRLKHTPKDFRVVIERSTCRLFLMDNQGPFKYYPTGLGMPGYETTLGKYTIGSKQKDPTWFRPNGTPVPPNDPANELGTRWMPMVPAEEGLPTDLGIHGTIAPETIGFYKSHGCPRLRNEAAEELYDLIVRSTPVDVVEKIDWSAMGAADPAPAGS